MVSFSYESCKEYKEYPSHDSRRCRLWNLLSASGATFGGHSPHLARIKPVHNVHQLYTASLSAQFEKHLRKSPLLSLFLISPQMSVQRLKIGCAGLGRMGKRHARNFLERTPRAELVAASSPDPTELEWAKKHLEPFGVRLYQSYDDMLQHEGLEAVVVASATAVHAEQAIKAIDADKHVLCEKPLSTSVEVVSILVSRHHQTQYQLKRLS